MDPHDQADLVHDFMLRIAPWITHWNLENSENPDPASSAKMALEWSMYLAAQCAACYDECHAPPPHSAPTQDTAATHKPETEGRAGEIRRSKRPFPG
jgi:hypothetical protein